MKTWQKLTDVNDNFNVECFILCKDCGFSWIDKNVTQCKHCKSGNLNCTRLEKVKTKWEYINYKIDELINENFCHKYSY